MFLLYTLLISAVLVAGQECDVGELDFKGFDPVKYTGTWYEHYRTPNSDENVFIGCEFDRYFESADGIDVISVAYNKTKAGFIISTGKIVSATDNSFSISYSNDPSWSSQYWVIGTDYDTYSIVTGCIEGSSTPLIWVASKSKLMSAEGENAVKEILQAHGLDFADLEAVDQSLCGDQ
ncbi:hypothetical protein C0J52_02748 [Blattella germanica]|nr:hypothetical protein C0J52_02748 [Blattella germanica]